MGSTTPWAAPRGAVCHFVVAALVLVFQGCQMNLHLGGHLVPSKTLPGSSWEGGFEIPIAALNLFDSVTILIMVPICEHAVFPALARLMDWTVLKKIGTGFLFAALSMVAAAICEHARRHVFDSCAGIGCSERLDGNVCNTNAGYNVANMSVLWQIPQYVLIGISEVFASIGAMEFFYAQAPESMRSSAAALNLITTALGTWFAAALTQLVNADSDRRWVTNDLNNGHFMDFFLLVGGLMVMTFLLFVYYSSSYQYMHMVPEDQSTAHAADRSSIAWSTPSTASFSRLPACSRLDVHNHASLSKTLINPTDQVEVMESSQSKFSETI
eukprot:TRINITY_DN11896_c0_g1_i3.p1 TRINITY_DN11896_c0_g1~~TRINITY_DN11896_c0_g1_i3.p1  ORF type:complete len:327 (-),score=49.87 TRINITY_DN11896_c0_g1_i3:218-1198(-)